MGAGESGREEGKVQALFKAMNLEIRRYRLIRENGPSRVISLGEGRKHSILNLMGSEWHWDIEIQTLGHRMAVRLVSAAPSRPVVFKHFSSYTLIGKNVLPLFIIIYH